MTESKDDDVWAAYARGVKKTKESDASAAPSVTAPPPLPASPARAAHPRVSIETMPDVWRKAIEQEPAAKTAKPVIAAPMPELPPAPAPTVWKREPLDLRVERNLSLGDIVIEAKIDLHGQTEAQAHEALLSFVEKQQRLGRRVTLVITGRGRDGASVLRQNLPRWCDVAPLLEAVLAVRTAAPHHGGEGAYYLLLRKKKE